jgi:hypothetical protein
VTAPGFVAKASYDFERERGRLLRLIDEFATKPLDGPWGNSAFLRADEGSRLEPADREAR